MESAEELGTGVKNTGMRGRHPTGLGGVLQGGGAGGSYIQVRDVGDEPLHGKGPGKFPAQGHQAHYRGVSQSDRGVGSGSNHL